MKKLLLILLLMPFALAAAAQQNDRVQIEQLRNKFIAALQDKKIDRSLALYTDDAVFFNPGGLNSKAQSGIRALYQMVTKEMDVRMNMHSYGIKHSGDLGYDGGEYSEDLSAHSTGKITHASGSYLMTVVKTGNSWKISRMMWTVKE